eukprot:scaffold83348_cov47-Phaeocystis_antarctica.AAC.2
MQPLTRAGAALRLLTPPLQRRTHRTPGCAHLERQKHSAARPTCAAAFSVRRPRHSAPTRCASPGTALPTRSSRKG